jgi:hypothetical protein
MPMLCCGRCDSYGDLLVPCARDDPAKIDPGCGHRGNPLPSGGCGRTGCQEAIKLIPCPRCEGGRLLRDAPRLREWLSGYLR